MSAASAKTSTESKSAPKQDGARTNAPSALALPLAARLGNFGLGRMLQAKLTVNPPNDIHEQEADRVADQVMRMPEPDAHVSSMHTKAMQRACSACNTCSTCEDEKVLNRSVDLNTITPIMRATSQEGSDAQMTPALESSIDALHGGGRPLPVSLREFLEPRFGRDFAKVRVHDGASAAELARSVSAHAFTVGSDIVFAAAQYNPGSTAGKSLLAHELTHVVQQGHAPVLSAGGGAQPAGTHAQPGGERVVQRHKASDPRLPEDKPEALGFAVDSRTAIRAALARLPSAADQRSRNVPSFIAQQRLTLEPLTPRHDSAAEEGLIRFFVGLNYANAFVLSDQATHHVDPARRSLRIRARRSDDVDSELSDAEIEERIVAAVSEVAHLSAAQSGAPGIFERYRAQFNAEWDASNLANVPTHFEPSLDSKGPRTFRARMVFERIYDVDVAIRNAYDANRGGIRERIDTYSAPESFNPLDSPRLQKLREVFFHAPASLSNAAFARFRPLLVAAAAQLDEADREAVDSSQDWQRLINASVMSAERRAELRKIIRTPPPAPVAPMTPAPAPAGPRQVVTPETTFVDGVTIEGPTAPILASGRRASVTLTPRSTVPNPGVNIDARFTIGPAGRVAGNRVSRDLKWESGKQTGPSFSTEIFNTSTVEMTAHLDLVNEPAGLAPAAPVPDLKFTVQDERQAHFMKNWFVDLGYRVGTSRRPRDPAQPPRYFDGAQSFWILSSLRDKSTNPGLALYLRVRMKRDGVVISAPQTLEPFPLDASDSPALEMPVVAPEPMPPTGDPLTFEVDLLAADQSTVLRTEAMDVKVLPERTYTKEQAIAQATADDAYLHDRGPTGLLTKMFAQGGSAAVAAAAIVAPDEPKLHVMPLTRRHDSRQYVLAVNHGRPNPDLVGYFVGTDYGNVAPDKSHSLAQAPAAGMELPEGFGPRAISVNVTNDVGAQPPIRRSDEALIRIIVHESVHALDMMLDPYSPIERYKTEFRAYWMDGAVGPPDQGTCPTPATPYSTPCAPKGCQDTEVRPELPPPGPKSCRARTIFAHMYGSPTYDFVKPAYDNNTGGFRDSVDRYVVPDGINLILSRRLESLRALIDGFSGNGFPTFRKRVQGFVGTGTAPAVGALSAEEWNEVKGNRAWRDLIDRKIHNVDQRGAIKEDLEIPE